MIFSGKRPDTLDIHNGKLSPCPTSPNCVCSQQPSKKNYIEPFHFDDDPVLEMEILREVIEKLAGNTIITSREDYLHAECKTAIMGFIDDLEFYWDKQSQLCHVRSASRLGYSDLGKNRSRVEEIRRLYTQIPSSTC